MLPSPESRNRNNDGNLTLFMKEIARLRQEFNFRIQAILTRIRHRKLKEIQEKIKSN